MCKHSEMLKITDRQTNERTNEFQPFIVRIKADSDCFARAIFPLKWIIIIDLLRISSFEFEQKKV